MPTSKRFAEDRGETVESGMWSTFESIVLNEVHQTFCTLPLPENIVFRSKSSAQIYGKLLHTKQQN